MVGGAVVGLATGYILTRGPQLGDQGSPLWVSLKVALAATVLMTGAAVAFAYLLSKGSFPGRWLIESMASLPIVMPPTVLGYYLIVVLGNNYLIGRTWTRLFGHPLLFSQPACIIAGSLVAFPFCMRTAKAAIDGVDPLVEQAARTMGMSERRVALTVTLPLARRGIGAGMAMGLARALGDFGTTLMVGGYIPRETLTMPIALYNEQQFGSQAEAGHLALILVVTAVTLLGAATYLGRSTP